ncbi:MAG: ATP-binding cassette domain-containing protein [Nitriliruptorales bacterium]|nr:ATP-binding cassette domain-containing protein [Nitriliruptorales bacterium]
MGTRRRRPYCRRMNVTPSLWAKDISRRYGRRTVLDGAGLHVDAGEAVAIIGENGAGKTTLLRVCAGLLRADAGTVAVRGRVGYCPQEPGLVDLLTAEEHVVLFGAGAGLSRREARTTGMELLESLGFPVGDKAVAKDLSGGTRQKLNLALALLGNPAVLLLDEPYQGFDMGSYVDFWSHVDTWRDEGRAVVIVTHLLTETHRVDRVVEVRGGAAHELTGAAA